MNKETKVSILIICLMLIVIAYANRYSIKASLEYKDIFAAVNADISKHAEEDVFIILDTNIDVVASSSDWSSVVAIVESRLVDGSVDVVWNQMILRKVDGNWEVTSRYPINPYIKGSSENIDISNVDIFQEFCNNPCVDRLAGNARQSFVMYPVEKDQYKQMKVNIDDINSYGIYKNDKVFIERYSYNAGEKVVSCIVTYYKTMEGWKMVQVYNESM